MAQHELVSNRLALIVLVGFLSPLSIVLYIAGLTVEGILVVMIFAGALIIILFEKFDSTATTLLALCLSSLVVLLGPTHQDFASFVVGISWDTVLFVAAMMIVVSVAGSSGMFQYIALILAKRSRGDPIRLLWLFTVFVFVISLFLDPLPTMIVMGSFTVEICRALDIDPRPMLSCEIVVAVFGSFPSVVGAVCNMVVVLNAGVDAGLMFIIVLPLSLLFYAITMPLMIRYYGPELKPSSYQDPTLLLMIEPAQMIKSRRDFYLSALAMGVLLTGFVAQVEASMIALIVASAMLVFTSGHAKELLQRLSWDTVFYLVGLFGIISALDTTGVVASLIGGASAVVAGNPYTAILFMLWIPGVAFSTVDNVPLAALLAPLAAQFKAINAVVPFALIVGTNIGVYLVPVGDASIMVAVNLTEKQHMPMRLLKLARFATPVGFMHLAVATAYFFLCVYVQSFNINLLLVAAATLLIAVAIGYYFLRVAKGYGSTPVSEVEMPPLAT